MAEGTPAVYVDIILKTISERPWKDGKGFGLWVVQTFKNGQSERVKVVAGMYSPNKVTGEKVLPKDGLELSHFTAVGAIWKTDILPLLQIPKGTALDPRTTDAPTNDDIEMPIWMK